MEIDRSYLREFYMGDKTYAVEIFGLFLEEGTREVEKLSKALARESWTEVRYYAHKIKPSMAMVGFPKASTSLEELERVALDKNGPQARVLLGQFMEMYSEMKPQVAKAYADMQAGKSHYY